MSDLPMRNIGDTTMGRDFRASTRPNRATMALSNDLPISSTSADGDLRGGNHIDVPEPAGSGKYVGAAVVALALACGLGYAYHAGMFTPKPTQAGASQSLLSPTLPASAPDVAPPPTAAPATAPMTAPANAVQTQPASQVTPAASVVPAAPVRIERRRVTTTVTVRTPVTTPADTTPDQSVPQTTVTTQTTNTVAPAAPNSVTPQNVTVAPPTVNTTPPVDSATPTDTPNAPPQNEQQTQPQQPQTTPQQ